MTLTVGSLFSGIGGIDLGLERAGMRVVWQCEKDAYCRRVLARHWPDVPCYDDVTTVDWSTVEPVDLICGGYPCQPFSLAGRRDGAIDDRHLWPYFADALRVLRPRWALLENVPGHLSLGFGDVLGELATLGYDTEWDCVPAAAVGAPHIRDRVFVVGHRQTTTATRAGEEWRFLAHAASGGQRGHQDEPCRSEEQGIRPESERSRPHVADTDRPGFPHLLGSAAVAELARFRAACRAGWWDIEPDVGRVADGVPARVDRLRALGNAVVPQVAEWVGAQLLAAVNAEATA